MHNITACLVVYNEDKCIARSLESLKKVVDEIIVVHDGECTDKTLEICRSYGARIFIRPHAGFMEAHLPFCFEQAKGDWLLRIDADEYLSPELKNNLRALAQAEEADAYEFLWPRYDGKKYISRDWPRKLCFFRKNKVSFLGIPHYMVDVKGVVKRCNFIMEHRPNYNNLSWSVFISKWIKWSKIQADSYFQDFNKIAKFNYDGTNWPAKIELRKKFPLLLIPLEFIVTFVKSLLSGGYKEGFVGYKVAFMKGIYRAMINYYIFKNNYVHKLSLWRR